MMDEPLVLCTCGASLGPLDPRCSACLEREMEAEPQVRKAPCAACASVGCSSCGYEGVVLEEA